MYKPYKDRERSLLLETHNILKRVCSKSKTGAADPHFSRHYPKIIRTTKFQVNAPNYIQLDFCVTEKASHQRNYSYTLKYLAIFCRLMTVQLRLTYCLHQIRLSYAQGFCCHRLGAGVHHFYHRFGESRRSRAEAHRYFHLRC